MTMTSWPYVAQDATDIEYGRLFREMAGSDGMAGSYGDNTLKVTGDGSGLSVKMATGAGIARGYMFYSTAIESLAIATPSAGVRMDLVVLELNLSNPNMAERILPKVLLGTSGSLTPPSLTQTATGIYQIPLATVQVDPSVSVITAGKVLDARTWLDQSYGAWTTARRPVAPRKYKLGFNDTTGSWEYHDGAGWVNLVSLSLESAAVTGVLPITKGGTGAITAGAAANNIGFYVQSLQPAYAASRVWIKTPA